MLGVVFDVGDKLNAELSTYGSNITVQPKADAVVSDLYNTESGGATSTSDPTAFLKESDAAKIKTIFWSFNITSFAPQLNIHATVNGYQRAGRRHVVQQEPQESLPARLPSWAWKACARGGSWTASGPKTIPTRA